MWYIYTIDYYPDLKNNAIMPFVATWVDLEIIITKSVREIQISYDITYMQILKK